jgi:hypothetical protein
MVSHEASTGVKAFEEKVLQVVSSASNIGEYAGSGTPSRAQHGVPQAPATTPSTSVPSPQYRPSPSSRIPVAGPTKRYATNGSGDKENFPMASPSPPTSVKASNRRKHVLDVRALGSPSGLPVSSGSRRPMQDVSGKRGNMTRDITSPTFYERSENTTPTPSPPRRGFYVPSSTAASRSRTVELPSPGITTKHRGTNFATGTFSQG